MGSNLDGPKARKMGQGFQKAWSIKKNINLSSKAKLETCIILTKFSFFKENFAKFFYIKKFKTNKTWYFLGSIPFERCWVI
jgi:hypothetical protein